MTEQAAPMKEDTVAIDIIGTFWDNYVMPRTSDTLGNVWQEMQQVLNGFGLGKLQFRMSFKYWKS